MLIEENEINDKTDLIHSSPNQVRTESENNEKSINNYTANISPRIAICEVEGIPSNEVFEAKRRRILPISVFSHECQTEVSNFLCSLCSGVFVNPVCLCCGHIFCDTCIKSKIKEDGCCPTCRKQIKSNSLYEVELIKEILNKKNVKCQSNECSWVGTLFELWKHIDTDCKFKEYYCSNSGCNYSGLKSDLKAHLLSCEYRLTICSKCDDSVRLIDMELHTNDVCRKVIINCPKGCNEQVLRANLLAHYTECLESEASCSLIALGCTFRGKKKELASHISSSFDNHFLLMYSQKLNTSNIFAKYLKRVDEFFNPPQLVVINPPIISQQQFLKRKRGRPPKNPNVVQQTRDQPEVAVQTNPVITEESQSCGKIGMSENNSLALISAHKTAVPMNLGIKKNGNSFNSTNL